jgi:ring-1,2-phenylacetyl-CoA epoxidase subunit PaaC
MELFKPTDTELWAAETGVGPDLEKLKSAYLATVKEVLAEANLTIHEDTVFQYGAKTGMHSENMGFILAEFQYMQRAYPNMKW